MCEPFIDPLIGFGLGVIVTAMCGLIAMLAMGFRRGD